MQSNSPLTNVGPIRKLLYRGYPDDLRPSRLTHLMAHAGTAVELTFPIVLVLSDGGTTTTIALVVMLLFHTFITSSIPMGVPIEWNIIMVYGAFVLFGPYADVSAFSVSSPLLIAFLAVTLVGLPLVGNLVPSRVSFLSSMRYYAGNWAYSVWLFKGDSSKKLDAHLIKAAPRLPDQLRKFLDDETIIATLSKVLGFRAMHLHGRCLHTSTASWSRESSSGGTSARDICTTCSFSALSKSNATSRRASFGASSSSLSRWVSLPIRGPSRTRLPASVRQGRFA